MTIKRRNVSTEGDVLSLCEEAKEGALFGVRLGDDFAVAIAELGPPDDVVTGAQHVRYGTVEIAADPNGKVYLLYAEVPEGSCISVGAITGKVPPAGDATSVGRARLVYGEGGLLSSVAVWPPDVPEDDTAFEYEPSVPAHLRARDAWLALCREALHGTVFAMRPGDPAELAVRLLGVPLERHGSTMTMGTIDVDVVDGTVAEIVVLVPRAARVMASDLGVECEFRDGVHTVRVGPAEMMLSPTGRVLQIHLEAE